MTCRCGHDRDLHEHDRAGSDCGVCGPRACRSFRRRWLASSGSKRPPALNPRRHGSGCFINPDKGDAVMAEQSVMPTTAKFLGQFWRELLAEDLPLEICEEAFGRACASLLNDTITINSSVAAS